MSHTQSDNRLAQSNYGNNRADNLLRSPESLTSPYRNFSSSYLRSQDDKLTESALTTSTRNQPASTQKRGNFSIDQSNPKVDTTKLNDGQRSTRASRPATKEYTPRKIHFYSEYLKDFDPVVADFRSPPAKRENFSTQSNEDLSRPRGFNYTSERRGERSVDRKDITSFKLQPTAVSNTANSIPVTQSQTISKPEPETSKYYSPSRTPDRATEGSYKASGYDREHRQRSGRKDEIRAKLSKLSEKLYSPLKSKAETLPESSRLESEPGYGDRSNTQSSFAKREYSNPYISKTVKTEVSVADTVVTEPAKKSSVPDYRESRDSRVKSEPSDLGNADSFKSHLEQIEKRHDETVTKLRNELREAKDALLKERTENTARNNNEIRNLNDKLKELERAVQNEAERARAAIEKADQTKLHYEKKLSEIREEGNKIREEKDKKILELNTLLKNAQKAQRDAVAQAKTDSEVSISKIKEEQTAQVRDLQAQLDKKNLEIERLRKDKEASFAGINPKSSNLNEMIRNLQEINEQLKSTVEQKNAEIQRLTKRVTDAKRDYTGVKTEFESIDREKSKLSEENYHLKTRVNRLDNLLTSGSPYKSSPRKSPKKGSPYKSHYY